MSTIKNFVLIEKNNSAYSFKSSNKRQSLVELQYFLRNQTYTEKKAKELIKWTPKYSDIQTLIQTMLQTYRSQMKL